MKKPYVWFCIVLALIAIGSLFNISQVVSDPTDLPRVDQANIATSLVQIVVILTLIYLILRNRKDHNGEVQVKPEPDSIEDKSRLEHIRDWLIAFVFVNEFTGSVQFWMLNNFHAGFTLINVTVVLDIICNLVLAYFVFQLIKNRNSKYLNRILVAVVLIVLVGCVSIYTRMGWLGIITSLSFLLYFGYAIRVPITRKSFKIGAFVLLPLSLIIPISMGYLINKPLNQLSREELKLEEQYKTQNSVTGQSYVVFLQKNSPTSSDIQDVRNNVIKGDEITRNIIQKIEDMKKLYNKQLPNIQQQKILYHLDNYKAFLNLVLDQSKKIDDFMVYASKVNFDNLSKEQANNLITYKNAVDALSIDITNASYKMSNDLR